MQCQTYYRNALKSSLNKNIQSLWKNTSQSINIQYDVYRNTREVLKAVRSEHKAFKTILYLKLPFCLSSLTTFSLWPVKYGPQLKAPCFTINYLSNSLATRNLNRKLLSRLSALFAICRKPYFTFLHAAKHTPRKAVGAITLHYTS